MLLFTAETESVVAVLVAVLVVIVAVAAAVDNPANEGDEIVGLPPPPLLQQLLQHLQHY